MSQEKVIYTIGHSNRTLDDFLRILKSFEIELIADVRTLPGSRKYPHFDKEQLVLSLPDHGINYVHLLNLGGRKKPAKDSKNTRWKHTAFRGYADYMESDEFARGIEELENAASHKRTAYMCSEAVWWSCHRAMISDYLMARGWKVLHLMSVGKSSPHKYTSPARIVDGVLSYGQED